jgi:hypothetical protein
MDCSNLATVFGPNLLKPRVESMERLLMDSANVNAVVSALIQHQSKLFCTSSDIDTNSTQNIVSNDATSVAGNAPTPRTILVAPASHAESEELDNEAKPDVVGNDDNSNDSEPCLFCK